ncbi:recombinase family protein [Desulfosporosinus sp. FKA]|uniref:recombinase family protein n=1 Tax=Desulfosporosinus sp. FKA TaxID=1969834 RepID=UPI000B499879|nr:recombinase family protein [Desulfosporosinus sp. FKA]
MHGILYLRKSREDEQYEKNTGEDVLQTHRERLTQFCNAREITFDERAEVKSGDTIAGRPQFQQVLNIDIPSGQYECIIVTEISRLGRGDMEDAGRIYKTIITHDIKIVTPNKIYDPNNSSDLRQLRFELFMSREEYESIKERLWNNRNYRATQGYAGNYIVTLGFRQSRGIVEIIPEEANLVKEIFTMRAEGNSYQEIATYMNSRNLKTKRGTQYHLTTICKILHNPRYIGIARWNGKQYKAKHPAIIPLDLWEKVQEINSIRKHNKQGTKENNPYLVELYCHECGRRMYGEHRRPSKTVKGVKRWYTEKDIYICSGKNKSKCFHSINANKIHQFIINELKKIIDNPEIFKDLSNERESKIGGNNDALELQLDELYKQVKSKDNLLSKLESDYESGDLPALLYTKHVDKTSREKAALENRINQIKITLSKSDIKIESPEKLRALLDKVLKNWDRYPNKSKKIIIQSFLSRVEVDKQGEFYVARRLPYTIDL